MSLHFIKGFEYKDDFLFSYSYHVKNAVDDIFWKNTVFNFWVPFQKLVVYANMWIALACSSPEPYQDTLFWFFIEFVFCLYREKWNIWCQPVSIYRLASVFVTRLVYANS